MVKAGSISIALGKAIKQERIKKGVTQEELADRCGLDRTYISKIERGLKNPTLSVVWEIATMGLKIDFLSLMAMVVQHLPVTRKNQIDKPSQDDRQE
ncbi:hypothetical protein GCM10027190_11230 [Spirosoma areae]